MSYSISADTRRADVLTDLRRAADTEADGYEDAEGQAAVREQMGAAIDAVERLLPMVGRPDEGLTVMVTGHANPEHEPRDGFADEALIIDIRVQPTREAEELTDTEKRHKAIMAERDKRLAAAERERAGRS